MKYVLDFDRVIFDTERFVADLRAAHIYDANTPRTVGLLDDAEAHGIDLKNYVHEGVLDFLRTHEQDVSIVSSFFSRNDNNNNESDEVLGSFQKEKIERALSSLGRVPDIYITARDKSELLLDLFQRGSLFLDDEPENINTARELGYRSVWFATPKKLFSNPEHPRDSIDSMGDVPTVTSFEQFTELLKTWESDQT